MHRCPNRACPSRGLETLINWVMAAMDIEGVGEQFVRRLWDQGLVRSMPDLYRLTKEQLLELDGYGGDLRDDARSTSIERVEGSMPFSRVLFGLNIPDVGWVTAQNLARHFGDVDAAARGDAGGASRRCDGIGPDRAEAIAEWFADEREPRARRGAARARARASRPARRSGRSRGRSPGSQYVITGTLEAFTREEAQAALEALGAKVSDSVSKKTTGVDRRREPRLEAREGGEGGRADPRRVRRSQNAARVLASRS